MAKVLKRDTYLQRRATALQEELNILEDNIKKMKTEIIGIKDKESAARWKLIRRHRILPLFPLALTYWAIFGGSIPALLIFSSCSRLLLLCGSQNFFLPCGIVQF